MTAHKPGSGSGVGVFVGASPPASPTDGQLWWDTDDTTAVGSLTYDQFGVYNGGGSTSVANEASGFLLFGALGAGIEVIDASTANTPTVLASGIYAVSVVVLGLMQTTGGWFHAILHLDATDQDNVNEGDSRPYDGVNAPLLSLTTSFYIPAGGAIKVQATNHDGAQAVNFSLQEISVQRLS